MTATCPECAAQRTLARHYKRSLKELTTAVRMCMQALDSIMALPEGRGRGRLIAQVSNALEMANDRARYFGLGVDWRRDLKTKRAEVR
jgi:ribosomal protein L13E